MPSQIDPFWGHTGPFVYFWITATLADFLTEDPLHAEYAGIHADKHSK